MEGLPFIGDAQAVLFCTCDGHLPYGTHGIFVGLRVDVQLDKRISPLIYLNGHIATWEAAPADGIC